MLVYCRWCWFHSSGGAEDKWREGSVFDFSNSFFITPYFLSFLLSVAFVEWGVTVGRCKWVNK